MVLGARQQDGGFGTALHLCASAHIAIVCSHVAAGSHVELLPW